MTVVLVGFTLFAFPVPGYCRELDGGQALEEDRRVRNGIGRKEKKYPIYNR